MRIALLLLALVVSCDSPPPKGDELVGDGGDLNAPSDAEVPGDIEYDPPSAIEPEHTTLEEELELVGHDDATTIVVPAGAARPVVLAGQEVRRYMYLRTGVLPGLVSTDALPDGDVLLVSPDSHLLVEGLRESLGTTTAERGFLIKSVADGQRTVLVITGHEEFSRIDLVKIWHYAREGGGWMPPIYSPTREENKMSDFLKRNEGKVDRILRVVFGLALLSLVFVGPRTLWGLLGLIPLTTGSLGICPIYSLLGVNTCASGECEDASA